jgi:hypothetical protein
MFTTRERLGFSSVIRGLDRFMEDEDLVGVYTRIEVLDLLIDQEE